ncbi:MAG: elongation factor P [Candidatus Omnitrophica bacterium]|nr:elongation factor P [Candidatus Omnitrophota bacterium]MDD5352302.1 elongation factor P [Candidatus Omnitrophota bacterium]MDD5549900.1 elongation factor P [Candidatus Omnitrophota bacterium]
MTLEINQLKTGVTITIGNDAFMVISVDHVKPGKGAAFARTRLKNLKLGTVIERTFRSDDKIQEAFIEEKNLQYSYQAGDTYHFLDQDSFEDISIEKERLGDATKFLKDNLIVSVFFFNKEMLNISLPNSIEFKIIHTEPGFKGDSTKSSGKPATIETGAVIQVPLFVNLGDVIKVDTRTGEYLGRV